MILTGSEIEKQVKLNRIHINPFIPENLNPNSYNFRLGKTFKIYKNKVLDSAKENFYKEITIPETGFILEPHQLYLGHTIEEMGSDHYVPIMQARSSIGRLGLYIYLNSGLGDLGFKKQWTLELHSIHKLKVYPGMKIGQMLFWEPRGKIILYQGKYKDSRGPEVSQIWKDFARLE
ncbi:MAG: dCTP deaminase [Nanoarchaeota archaeon]|nr:dCTP deaminase [Nanoarchaeota archaeon]